MIIASTWAPEVGRAPAGRGALPPRLGDRAVGRLVDEDVDSVADRLGLDEL